MSKTGAEDSADVSKSGSILVAALYKFVTLHDCGALRAALRNFCAQQGVKGTLLLAPEGINGTIAGDPEAVRAVLAWLRSDRRFADLSHKESTASSMPFERLKVRVKREIVTMGVPDVNPAELAGTYVRSEDWNALLDDPDVVVIDVRNDYEVALGSFPGALNPGTRSFRELPAWLRSQAVLRDKPKVAMFCTGGIRCEKSTAFLRAEGFPEVYHLAGGILKYLETIEPTSNRWEGECFVFDERVTLGPGLAATRHELCRSCQRPIFEADKTSVKYVPGLSCPRCYDEKTAEKRASLDERRRQLMLAAARKT